MSVKKQGKQNKITFSTLSNKAPPPPPQQPANLEEICTGKERALEGTVVALRVLRKAQEHRVNGHLMDKKKANNQT